MTTMAHALTDSRTMLRRQLLHLRRYPSLTGLLIGMPVIFLLLFATSSAARSAPGSAATAPRM